MSQSIPLRGIQSSTGRTAMAKNSQESIIRRLKRIEGQAKGLIRMLEEDRYCIDILHQIQATKAALTKVETELLRSHARECVDEALRRGTVREKREKIVELVDLFERVR